MNLPCPEACAACATELEVVGSIVEQSINSRFWLVKPSVSSVGGSSICLYTPATWCGSGRQVMIVSFTQSVFSPLPLHTRSSWKEKNASEDWLYQFV